jgi:hypothetical protein
MMFIENKEVNCIESNNSKQVEVVREYRFI